MDVCGFSAFRCEYAEASPFFLDDLSDGLRRKSLSGSHCAEHDMGLDRRRCYFKSSLSWAQKQPLQLLQATSRPLTGSFVFAF